jgi:hypothetical protein
VRRALAAAVLLAAAFTAVPAAHAEPQWICPWSVSVAYHAVTGEYLCYA